jgi:hypothetical protein
VKEEAMAHLGLTRQNKQKQLHFKKFCHTKTVAKNNFPKPEISP